ncbi:MAG: membrane associated rhomboid family serine protease, partial [Bacteroidia bacterium]
MHYQASNHGMFPPVIKNIIIINVLMLLAKMIFAMRGINLDQVLGLFYFQSSQFNVWQIITHVFMHGDVMHLAFNMIGLWFFGRRLEIIWGPQRFLFFYLVTALGAAFLHFLVIHIQISQILPLLDLSLVEEINRDGYTTLMNNMNWNGNGGKYNLLANIPTVGASGAIFGILGA